MKPLFEDTPPHVEKILLSRIRAMTPQERFARIGDLNETLNCFVQADIERRYPNASPEEVRLRVFSRRIPAPLMLRVYGWNVKEKGY